MKRISAIVLTEVLARFLLGNSVVRSAACFDKAVTAQQLAEI